MRFQDPRGSVVFSASSIKIIKKRHVSMKITPQKDTFQNQNILREMTIENESALERE